jgi:GAF domain-containing protein
VTGRAAGPRSARGERADTAYAQRMSASAEATRVLRNALARAEAERLRAERTAEIAERHEQRLLTDPVPLQEFHLRMATMHRQVQRQHLAAAAIHTSHADRLRTWADAHEQQPLPKFMASVAEVAHADGAAVTLFGAGLVETLTVVSDPAARAAQDLEFALGEGPSRDIMSSRKPIRAVGDRLHRRWPNYGSAVERLGIRSIAAVPIELTGVPLGALTLFGPHQHVDFDSLVTLGGTVATMLVPKEDGADEYGPQCPLLVEADDRAVVYQAAGVVSVQLSCTVPDALALIRARAFADDQPLESIASSIVEHRLRLV